MSQGLHRNLLWLSITQKSITALHHDSLFIKKSFIEELKLQTSHELTAHAGKPN